LKILFFYKAVFILLVSCALGFNKTISDTEDSCLGEKKSMLFALRFTNLSVAVIEKHTPISALLERKAS
jgi:hypothetical protein